MAEHSRYNVSQKQAGVTKSGVLANKMGITKQKDLDEAEALLLDDSYTHFFDLLQNDNLKLTYKLIFDIHQYFLTPLYTWSGTIRTVDISKNDFLFAPAKFLQSALKEFGEELENNLPKAKDTKKQIAKKLAWIHTEFNFIHPFREGNGRTVRLFLDLLVANGGYQPIDYNTSTKNEYINACIAGMSKDYSKMEKVMNKGLTKRK
jgi:cell filamentation protein